MSDSVGSNGSQTGLAVLAALVCVFCSLHDEQGGTTAPTCCSISERWCCVAHKALLVGPYCSPHGLLHNPTMSSLLHLAGLPGLLC